MGCRYDLASLCRFGTGGSRRGGCGSGQSPSLVAGPTDDAQAVRLQKPEIEKVRYSLLDTKPDPLAESTKANVAASIRATVNGVPDSGTKKCATPAFLCCSI